MATTGDLVFAHPNGAGGFQTSPLPLFSADQAQAPIDFRTNVGFRVYAEQSADKFCASPVCFPSSPRFYKARL